MPATTVPTRRLSSRVSGRAYRRTSLVGTSANPRARPASASADRWTGADPAGRSRTREPAKTQTCESIALSFGDSRTFTRPSSVSTVVAAAAARERSRLFASRSRLARRTTLKATTSRATATVAAISANAVSRPRSVLKRLISLHPVADAVHRHDARVHRELAELAPQPRHVLVERVVVHGRAVRPGGADEVAPPDHRMRLGAERREQAELGRGERDLAVPGSDG